LKPSHIPIDSRTSIYLPTMFTSGAGLKDAPASLFPRDEGRDEATDPVMTRVRNTEGLFFAAAPTNGAMWPRCPIGQLVVFQDAQEREPGDLDIVYVSLSTRKHIAPRRWWQFWRKPATVLERCNWRFSQAIRRYRVDHTGRVSFEPLMPGYERYVEGLDNGRETDFIVLGVASGHQPIGYHIAMVQC
jgi:hypothetical protein